jgi:hypothetical protein
MKKIILSAAIVLTTMAIDARTITLYGSFRDINGGAGGTVSFGCSFSPAICGTIDVGEGPLRENGTFRVVTYAPDGVPNNQFNAKSYTSKVEGTETIYTFQLP